MEKPYQHFRLGDLLAIVLKSAEHGMPIAYCRVVETRGSTPQKAGAVMLVRPDGAQVGTIGGGCVEAEVKSRAQLALQNSKPEIANFALTGDYGWDDGLICGGRMRIAIEPVTHANQLEYFHAFHDHVHGGGGGTEAVACSDAGVPMFMLFDEFARLVSSLRIDDSTVVTDSSKHILSLDQRPRPYSVESVAFLPVFPPSRLIIVGAGHVGKAVAELAASLDFDVWVIDDRSDYASKTRFPFAQKIIVGPIQQSLQDLSIDNNCYCLIVTRGHKQDEKALYHLVDRDARYVGLIGSRRKLNLIFEDLIEAGISVDLLSTVHAPVGIDIGSQSVPEIAISIAAELVAHRNTGGSVPGRPQPVRVAIDEPSPLS